MKCSFSFYRQIRLALIMGPCILLAAAAESPAACNAAISDIHHLRLDRSIPTAEEVLEASPERVTLYFTQVPQMAGTSVRLLPTGGEPLQLPAATADEEDPSVVVLPVPEALANGDYTVMWRAMAQDGHTIRDDFHFSLVAESRNRN